MPDGEPPPRDIRDLLKSVFRRKDSPNASESKPTEPHVAQFKDLIAMEGDTLPHDVFISMDVDHKAYGSLPAPKPYGIPMNANAKEMGLTEKPVWVLTVSDEHTHLKLATYMTETGDFLTELSGQEWSTVKNIIEEAFTPSAPDSGDSEESKLKSVMDQVIGDSRLQKKRISVMGKRNGQERYYRQIHPIFQSIDLPRTIHNINDHIAQERLDPDAYHYTVQTVTGTKDRDGWYVWDQEWERPSSTITGK